MIQGPCISWDFAATISFSWSVNCSSLALKLFILDTTKAYLIGLSCPNFFYIPFLFFLQEYKVFGFIVVSLISFFSMSQLSNFLKSSFLTQHPCSSWLPICFDPQGGQRTIPGSPVVPLVTCCYLGVSI